MTRRLSLSSGARPNLSKMFATCFSTTFGEMNNVVAMAALERPWAMSESTSRSRGVRAARVSPRRLAVRSWRVARDRDDHLTLGRRRRGAILRAPP
jgi:hypothetical protein